MDTVRNRLVPLEEIPANRHLVEQLYAYREISPKARSFALNMLYPARNWGLWIARLLTALGVALVLSGVVYFYAFNWAAIPDLVKLGSVEFALAGCIAAALFFGLNRNTGKILALSAATLTGVFLAVFGQVYQTGADAWTLFGTWAVLITPWAVAATFAPLWALWLGVANIGICLFWDQAVLPSREMEALILPIVAGFNGAALAVREILESRYDWLQKRWTRVAPALAVIGAAAFPCVAMIVEWRHVDPGLFIAAMAGAGILLAMFAVFRYIKPDMPTVAATVLAACVILEFGVFRLMDHHVYGQDSYVLTESLRLLLQSAFTIALFTGAVIWLRLETKKMEVRHG
ncbi:MAG: DUF2157 domain-containing protein [Alphaproteobacteria bacterium]|nr:MAG: DUF2157 domain-containing protein [Alphaproteobacteria bacterium]